jgi:hypothetical protein
MLGEPIAVIRGVDNCREAMYGGHSKNCMCIHRRQNLPFGPSEITNFRDLISLEYSLARGAESVSHECLPARRVRAGVPRMEGVGACGGQPQRIAKTGRPLPAAQRDNPLMVELPPGGIQARQEHIEG